jgi:hypothetical protein
VTDALDRLSAEAVPLLRRVDAALTFSGASADDAVWPLLRRVRALPSDAVAAVAGWRAEPLAATAAELRSFARRWDGALDTVAAPPPWEGAAAEAYRRRWAALHTYARGGGADSAVGRLRATADHLDALAEWVTRSRRALAAALADALTSAEAVTLLTARAPDEPPAAPGEPVTEAAVGSAAARLAVHVLTPVAVACDEGRALSEDAAPRLSQLVYRPAVDAAVTEPGLLRLGE